MFTIKALQANYGDSILIRYGDGRYISNILVDGGIARTYSRVLKQEVTKILEAGEAIELLVVTHIHDDHLLGIVKLFSDVDIDKSAIKRVWFNSKKTLSDYIQDLAPEEIVLPDNESREMGVNKAKTLEKALEDIGCWENTLIQFGNQYTNVPLNGAKITVLSPHTEALKALKIKMELDEDRQMGAELHDYEINLDNVLATDFEEDESVYNQSSISFLLEYDGKKIMLLGDSLPSDIIKTLITLGYSELNPLKVDIIKLSHHASKKNTSIEFLNLVECSRYIVSTDGSKKGMPSKECLARIVKSKRNVELLFNYNIHEEIFSEEECQKYGFICRHISDHVEV